VRFAGSGDRGFSAPGLWDAVRTSVIAASIATALITVLGVPLAYALARARGRLVAVTGILVQLPLALPPVMSGIVLIYLVGPYTPLGRFFHGALTDSLTGIVLAQAFVSAPFIVIAAREAFAGIDPALDDLAATLGHRPLARFARVWLRTAAPSVAAGMLLTWLRALGEYGARSGHECPRSNLEDLDAGEDVVQRLGELREVRSRAVGELRLGHLRRWVAHLHEERDDRVGRGGWATLRRLAGFDKRTPGLDDEKAGAGKRSHAPHRRPRAAAVPRRPVATL